MPGLLEEMKKKVNRPVPELPMSEDADVLEVQSGNGNGHDRRAQTLTSMITNQQDAPTCPNCGWAGVGRRRAGVDGCK